MFGVCMLKVRVRLFGKRLDAVFNGRTFIIITLVCLAVYTFLSVYDPEALLRAFFFRPKNVMEEAEAEFWESMI